LAQRIPARLTPSEGRRFAFTVGTAFLVFGALAWWRGHATLAPILGALGVALWGAGVVAPGRLTPVHRAWMGLAHAISKVTTPIFMGVVYFVVLLPVGLLMRLMGRNPIRHRAVDGSYWAPRAGPRGGLTNQF
jgi:hypothetical protein